MHLPLTVEIMPDLQCWSKCWSKMLFKKKRPIKGIAEPICADSVDIVATHTQNYLRLRIRQALAKERRHQIKVIKGYSGM